MVAPLLLLGLLSSSCAALVRTSVSITGGDPNGESQDVALSEDGRFAAFASFASDLVPNDNNGVKDIFVRDHQSGVTELISLSMNGGSANGISGQPDITPDGRFVVFWSFGDDIVAGDTNGGSDVFVYDRDTDTMEMVSVANDGSQGEGALGGSISDNGQRVAFYEYGSLDPNDTNSTHDVYVRDRSLNTTKLMSTVEGGTSAAGVSYDPVISGIGTDIAFHTSSDDVIAIDNNGFSDVVWRTVVLNIRQLVSINTSGVSGNLHSYNPSISRLGDIVAFESSASDLVVGDTAGFTDVFRRDVLGLSTERVSQRPTGAGFAEGNGSSFLPDINADGTMIAYGSSANNLADPLDVPADTNGFSDVYLWEAGANTLGSQTFQALPTNGHSGTPSLSADGSVLGYETNADNLGITDGNGTGDVVVRPTFVPTVNSASGLWEVGETSTISIAGDFSLDSEVFFTGNGITATTVTAVTATTITVDVTTAPTATPGLRTFYVIAPATQLGLAPLFGGADTGVFFLQA